MMNPSDLVIVEMACKFPGANNLEDFWKCMIEQTDVFQAGTYSRTQININENIQTKIRSEVSEVFEFDSTKFSLTEEELLYTDPQQRLLLEIVQQIFSNTNFSGRKEQRNIGVFVGVAHNSYLDTINARFFEESYLTRIKDDILNEFSKDERQKFFAILNAQLSPKPSHANMIAGNLMNLIPNRISHEFDLKGPSIAIETACSSSLVAFHAACESIRSNECTSAIAAGVQVNLTPIVNYYMEAAGAVSSKGRLTAFDEEADGIVLGEGAGAVLIKKKEDAIRAGDNILCTIKASGVNNDGRSMGILAPNLKGQIDLIKQTYKKHAIDPKSIYAIEAHGTGTRIGDSVEINTLKSIFGKRPHPLYVTSVKSNIGHLLGAAGIASLIKAVLCLNNNMLPANKGLSKIPAKWEVDKYKLSLIKENKVINETSPVLIGINAFGFGGTNCHCVLSSENRKAVRSSTTQKLNKQRYQFNAPPPQVKVFRPTYVPVKREVRSDVMARNGIVITDDPENSLLLSAFTWPVLTGTNLTEAQLSSAEMLVFHYHHSLKDAEQIVKHVLKIRQLVNTPGLSHISLVLEGIGNTGFGRLLSTLFTGLGQEIAQLCIGILTTDRDLDSLQKASEILGQHLAGIVTIKKGEIVALNYEKIEPFNAMSHTNNSGYTLMVSGSSGIGLELSTYLSKKHEKIISIGRRSKKEVLKVYDDRKINPDNIEYFSMNFLDWKEVVQLARTLKAQKITISRCIFTLGNKIMPGSLLSKEEKYIKSQIASKIVGIENVRKLMTLLDQEPEVLLFSSTSAVITSEQRGILDYAMANAYLEGIALEYDYKVIHWGPWQNTGQAKSLYNGSNSIPLSRALECWESVAASKETSLLVRSGPIPTISTSEPIKSANDTIPTIDLNQLNSSSPRPDKINIKKLESFLLSELSALIGEELPLKELDTPLENLGLDSLDAVDLARKTEAAFGIKIEATLFFEYNTINKIISYLGGNGSSEKFKLLASQKNFLTAQLIAPDSPNNILLEVKFSENVASIKFQNAIKAVLNAIPELKLSFHLADDHQQYGQLRDHYFDLEVTQGANYQDFVAGSKEKINEIFSLSDEPLLKIYLQEFQNKANAMVFQCHHILLDGWSVARLFDAILDRYWNPGEQEENQNAFQLPDYVAAVNGANNDPENSLKYWQRTLKGYRGLQVSHDGKKNGRINLIRTQISEAKLLQLKSLASANSSSLFEVLLSIYFLTIYKLLKADDLIIGIANINRNRAIPGAFDQIGALANSIPVRVDLSEVGLIPEVIVLVKQALRSALKHSSIDSAILKNISEISRGENNSRLSPFGISYLNLDKKSTYRELVEKVSAHTTLSFVDLTLLCTCFLNKIELSWTYSETRFSDKTANKFVQTFSQTIDEIIASKEEDKKISRPEKYGLQMPAVDLFPGTPLIQDKIIAAAEKYSDKVAIEQNGSKVTYRELLSGTEKTAQMIGQLSSAIPIVAVLGFPSISSTISILSILRSGRAYLPLDPSWPTARIEQLLKISGVKAVCSGAEQTEVLKKLNFLETDVQCVFSVDQNNCTVIYGNLLEDENGLRHTTKRVGENDLAYVMYTSGTTGIPKGVMVSHKSLSIFLNWLQETFEFSESDRFMATSSLGFGGSLRQLFSTLLSGGTYLPIDHGLLQDPEQTLHFIIDQKITILNTVPSIWESLADRCGNSFAKPEHLRLMLIGGEKMPVSGLKRWRDLGLQAKIYNLYGSTETVVNATYFDTDELEIAGTSQVPIGKTRQGVIVSIVDENYEECPVGKVGKILVGGPGISSGYLNDASTTEKKYKFLRQIRFYDTGDFGYQDLHENYHFVGRKDNQIKIFGNRIDPAEIEICMTQVDGVKNSKVLGIEFNDTTYLVAFVDTDKPLDAVTEQLKEAIKQALPGYMTPHYIFKIDAIPLTQAKKVDILELNRLARQYIKNRIQTKHSSSLDVEEVVKTRWKEIFKTEDIHIDDDFFAIGGDSLNAYLMSVLLQDTLGFPVPPHMVYRYPTIRSLSRQLKERPTMEMGAVYTGDPKKLTNSERGFILLQKINGKTPVCCARIRMVKQLDVLLFKKAFKLVVEKHPILRSVFRHNGSEIVVEAISNYEYDIELHQYTGNESFEEYVFDEFEQLKNAEFHYDSWPLFHLSIVENQDGEKHLLTAMHHLIIDAWSFQVLFDEINIIYFTLLTNKSAILEPIDEVYQDARSRIHQRENTDTPEARQFWAKKLAGIPFKLDRIEDEGAIKDKLVLKINPSQTELLRSIAKSNRTSLFMVILWLWLKVLENISKEKGFLLGVAQNGRAFLGRKGGDLIGCFATGIPFPYKKNNKEDLNLQDQLKQLTQDLSNCVEHNFYSLRTLSTIHSDNSDTLFNFEYFLSFLDHQSMEWSKERSILIKEDMDLVFRAETGSSKLMASIIADKDILVQLLGYCSTELKKSCLEYFDLALKNLLEPKEQQPGIDSALIAYLPTKNRLKGIPNLLLGEIERRLFHSQLPFLVEKTQTKFGVSGLILLPIYADDLMNTPINEVKRLTVEAISLASNLGARVVSLAGNLPTLLNYGYRLKNELPAIKTVITTGHAATVVAVVLNTLKAIRQTHSQFCDSHLAIVGFGSIGRASLEMLLKLEGSPETLHLYELSNKVSSIKSEVLRIEKRYHKTIKIVEVNTAKIPDSIYEKDLIIVAATSPEILDVSKIRPGTIVVDDSFPSAMDQNQAIGRMASTGDVLLIGGGKIDLPNSKTEISNLRLNKSIEKKLISALTGLGFPGCRAESILMASSPELPATTGLVDVKTVEKYYHHCIKNGIDAQTLSIGHYAITNKIISNVSRIRKKGYE